MATRTTTNLEDISNREALTREQLLAARTAAFAVDTRAKEAEHLTRIAEDRVADRERGLPRPGHRKGRIARLVWPTTTFFDRWQQRFEGIPSIASNFTIRIGPTAYEFPGDEVTPPSGRRFTEIPVTEVEQDWLTINGVTLCDPGTFNPLTTTEDV